WTRRYESCGADVGAGRVEGVTTGEPLKGSPGAAVGRGAVEAWLPGASATAPNGTDTRAGPGSARSTRRWRARPVRGCGYGRRDRHSWWRSTARAAGPP